MVHHEMAAGDKIDSPMDRRFIDTSRLVKTLIALIFLVTLLSCTDPKQDSAEGGLTLFSTQQAAQKHCPKDTVVWLNLPSGIYHFQGERWYGNTKTGAFVCQQEANKAGDRATLNGQ
jgi:hypothetical protein